MIWSRLEELAPEKTSGKIIEQGDHELKRLMRDGKKSPESALLRPG